MDKKKPTSPVRTLEAIKLLNDWCKWLVGVQTAAITALGFLARTADVIALKTTIGTFAIATGTASIVLFTVSIAAASYLLLFLPSMAEELPDKYDEDNEAMPLSYMRVPFKPGWQVGTFTTWQSRSFILGIGLFGLSFVLLQNSR